MIEPVKPSLAVALDDVHGYHQSQPSNAWRKYIEALYRKHNEQMVDADAPGERDVLAAQCKMLRRMLKDTDPKSDDRVQARAEYGVT